MSSPNPYAPPATDSGAPVALPRHLSGVQRIYWWVGLVGTAGCGLYAGLWLIAVLAGMVTIGYTDLAELLPISVALCWHALLFNYCRIIANRLLVDPARFRRRARLVGFVMATLYFPILTVPGLYCVCKIDKHFEESGRLESELPLHGLPT
jgi:hypothetical protein